MTPTLIFYSLFLKQVRIHAQFNMSALTATNLGARQQELNKKINTAIKHNVDFEQHLRQEIEKSDVDKIYKIDIASKQKNIGYILEVLKSGDDFAITRALNKCTWICDDGFGKYINAEYVNHDIFPFMSIKMKKKFLTKISTCLKNENRLKDFYRLCCNEKFVNIGYKFLRFTSESFKMDEIREQYAVIPEGKHFNHFIGNSFTLAQNYLENIITASGRNNTLFALRNMYSVSAEKYLELLENYYDLSLDCHVSYRFGLRLSKNIITKHKDRVYENPSVYMNVLNPKVITKPRASGKLELFAMSLMPDDVSSFWSFDYCEKYKFLLDLVENHEKFSFVKKLFNNKYPHEQFDMCLQFYNLKLYKLMTDQEREEWALRQVASGQNLLGPGNDHMWYKFLPFDKALEGVKRSIIDTTSSEERSEIYEMLIETVKSQQDIKELLCYYYDNEITNHSNEDTEKFINKIMEQNKVLNFDECCWVALEKLFNALGVFDKLNCQNSISNYRVIALMYNIINRKQVPDILNEFLNMGLIYFPTIMYYKDDVNAEMMERVYQYILNYYSVKIKEMSAETSTNENKRDLHKHLLSVLDLMSEYKKKKDDLPEFMMDLIRSDWDKYKYHNVFKLKHIMSEGDIRRSLKTNAAFVVRDFSKIQDYCDSRFGNINWLFMKLKTYFSNDIGKIYLNKLMTCLNADDLRESTAVVLIRGIFMLADETEKVSFMQKYAPGNQLMDKEVQVFERISHIRRAICMQVCYSRPPLPLSCVTPYISEDSVGFCLPMFYNYSVFLPQSSFHNFLESLANKPFAVEKQGIILALKFFKAEFLISFISDRWNRSNDPSVRDFIYKTFFKKFRKENDETQQKLFGVLLYLTQNLKENDYESSFYFVYENRLPDKLKGHFLIAAWKAFSKFSDEPIKFHRMSFLIRLIEQDLSIIPERDMDNIIESHVEQMLKDKEILNENFVKDREDLIKALWDLTARNLSYVIGDKRVVEKLDIVKSILNGCLIMWNEVQNGTYIVRQFCTDFLKHLECYSYDHATYEFNNLNVMYNLIILNLQSSLPDHEIHMIIWNLRLGMETKKILVDESPKSTCNEDDINQTLAILLINCMVKLAEGFGELVKEYIEKKRYFTLFHKEMENILTHKILVLKKCLDRDDFIMDSLTDMSILLCTGLVQFTIPEIYLFMIHILPVDYSDTYIEEYKSVLKTIKNFPNEEVTYSLYEKFVNVKFNNFIDTL